MAALFVAIIIIIIFKVVTVAIKIIIIIIIITIIGDFHHFQPSAAPSLNIPRMCRFMLYFFFVSVAATSSVSLLPIGRRFLFPVMANLQWLQ